MCVTRLLCGRFDSLVLPVCPSKRSLSITRMELRLSIVLGIDGDTCQTINEDRSHASSVPKDRFV